MIFKIEELLTSRSYKLLDFTKCEIEKQIKRFTCGEEELFVLPRNTCKKKREDMSVHLSPEFFIQVSGKSIFHYLDGDLELLPRQLCIVPTGVYHSKISMPLEDQPYCNLTFKFHHNTVSVHINRNVNGTPQSLDYVEYLLPRQSEKISGYIDDIVELSSEEKPNSRLALQTLTLAYFHMMIRLLGNEHTTHEKHQMVSKSQAYISENISDCSMSVQSIAKSIGCSADYLSHLFQKDNQTNLRRYIIHHRILRAELLLKTTSLNIAEIARECGYDDPGYFSRAFKKKNGCTPKTYR